MDDKVKLISIEKMDEAMEERFPTYETVDYYGNNLVIEKLIPFTTFDEIVSRVSDICFNSETGEYLPQNKDFAIRLCVINAYTNVNIPENVEHQYRILYGTDIVDTVLKYINRDQYIAMVDAINETIRARNNANYIAFKHDVQQVVDQVVMLGDRFAEMFGDVTPDDIKGFLDAIGEDGVNEEKIVHAIVAEQNKQRGEVIQFPASDEGEPDGE